ncbi:hypothetical protein HA402_014228 [Bradysia odoriphaga]|nr:hypothetical protein HA402_014228 [Bradysia odoriphaga]
MMRLVFSPFWTANRFSLSTQSATFRSLHHNAEIFKANLRYANILQYYQCRGKKDDSKVSALFKPVPVQSNRDDIDIGAELTGKLDKGELLKILNAFTQKPEIKRICADQGLDAFLQQQAFASFRRYCIDAENLPADLHIIISDILQGAGHSDDILPYFFTFCS